jgi:uncharacterized protein involved in exopolysaccharide biosynthesis
MDSAELRALILDRDSTAPSEEERSPAISAPPSRLSVLQDQLTELRLHYTERHPEVIGLQQEIARLQNEAVMEPQPVADEPEVESADPRPAGGDPQRQAELEAAQMELENLRAERERAIEDIASYERRLEQTPRVELELLAMTRDYDNLQRAYDSLLGKKMDASLAENMEKGRQSEQFTILERADPPTKPYAPNPYIYLGVGTLGAALLAIGVILVREETDHTFNDADELRRAFPGVPILASVPRVTVLEEEAALEDAV